MIILFDGVCHLCQRSVQFIIARDPKGVFTFAPLGEASESIVLLDGDATYTKSSAALRIARQLTAPWKWLYALMLVPRPVRDAMYTWVAKNRYAWFGKDDACWVPTPALKARFLAADPRFATTAPRE